MADYCELYFDIAPNMNGRYMCTKCHAWFSRDEIRVYHKLPLENGGTDSLNNLHAICINCDSEVSHSATDTIL